ncbi:MAG: penicillin-binding protein 2 [Pyrinomonadaceae bacterium]|nr:penicillin-binding protein 2 [Pyrinomonadaceae bacterium]
MARKRRTSQGNNSMQTAFIRFMLVVAFFIFWIGAVSVRLVHLQVNEHSKWKSKSEAQSTYSIVTKSLRGSVYDRNGSVLAMSVRVKSLAADPGLVENVAGLSSEVSKITGKKASRISSQINEGKLAGRKFVWLARELTDEQVEKVKKRVFENKDDSNGDLALGVRWIGEQKRDYPNGTLAAHVIGFSNSDDVGQAGIEKSQESFLKAERLRMVRERDREGRVLSETAVERTPSKDVVLTLSKEIQHITERALVRAVKTTNAKAGKAIVMDPATGEILAMANYPTFDPSEFRKLKPGVWRNSAVQDQYAPGSVFKLVTYGAALEEGKIKPEDEIECGEGQITVGGYTFNDSHAVGRVSYIEAMAESSNVGAIKTAMDLGKDTFYSYAREFGFGKRTGVGLPSEGTGILRAPERWRGTDLASMSIGYGIDVTALQTVLAFATIANDGVQVNPQIVKEVRQDGKLAEDFESESRRVVKAETARSLKKMLKQVVLDGTAKRARLNGYTSAGKTGTAWKYDKEIGTINRKKYVSSFVGFAPADDPAVVIAIVVDEPKGAMRAGGQVAAPAFKEIAENVLPALKVAPDGVFEKDFPKDPPKKEKKEPKDSTLTEKAKAPKKKNKADVKKTKKPEKKKPKKVRKTPKELNAMGVERMRLNKTTKQALRI